MSKIDRRFLEGDDAGGGGITIAQLVAAIATGQWTERMMLDEKWRAVCWSPEQGLFCAVGGNKAATSPDGVTWTERTMPEGKWRGVCWSSELRLFCAVGDNKAATSPDGATWTERAIPSGNKHSVGWSRKLRIFCAVGDDGKAATSTPLFL